MKRISLVLLVCLVLFGCENAPEGFTNFGDYNYFKLITIGEDKSPSKKDFIQVELAYYNKKDSLIYSSFWDCFEGKKVLNYNANSLFVNHLFSKNEGDSLVYLLTRQTLKADTLPFEKTLDTIKVGVKINRVLTLAELTEEKGRIAWLKDREMNEQIDLLNYLAMNELDKDDYYNGIYLRVNEKGEGDNLKSGDLVQVRYKTYLLDGTLVDDIYLMDTPFEFKLGDPGQVIKGFGIGLTKMNLYAKATFVIPSVLGFGGKGSTTSVVPPYSSLIYEVEVVGINNFEQIQETAENE